MPSPEAPGLDTLFREGFSAHREGRLDVARARYGQVLAVQPRHFDALHLLGVIHMQSGDAPAAADLIGRALEVDPRQAVALNNRGVALQALRRDAEAADCFTRALALKPDHAEAFYNRANTRRDQGRFDDALSDYDSALRCSPSYAEAYLNRGIECARRDELARAVVDYDNALAIRPDFAEVHYNKGNALRGLGRLDEADAALGRAIALKSGFAEAHTSRGITRLLQGRFAAGWADYEWRWRTPEFGPPRAFAAPAWRGDGELRGNTILVHAEQGLGDTIQFCRYVPLLAAKGAKVVLEVPDALKALMTTLGGVSAVLGAGDVVPPYDVHSPLLSLPGAFGTTVETIPATIPYLAADPAKVARWADVLGPKRLPRIGLSWSGRASYLLDRHRSVGLEQLAPLLAAPAEFIALQKDLRGSDRAALAAHARVRHVGDLLADFSDTAALAQNLDLVISVDTVGAHLAGALGIPTWILLPFIPDWRWMMSRADTPWYPGARLFRQPAPGDWTTVVAQVADALSAEIGKS